MKAFKALGPDGFQPFFFKKFWNLLGDDMWKMIQDAFERGFFDERLLLNLIVFIPKVDHPKRFS